MSTKQKFCHSLGAEAQFEERGLRNYFEYRDLGIAEASNGDVVAHVIRAKEGHSATGQWHMHDCTFQMIYILKGWVRFEYEGQGEKLLNSGDSVLQPAGIRHREIEHSADLELIEIVSPADFKSLDVD
ncbi:MAG: cupin domain-containing protein [Motiliproteus sp.]